MTSKDIFGIIVFDIFELVVSGIGLFEKCHGFTIEEFAMSEVLDFIGKRGFL